jgi:hypothetical protein
MRHVSLFKNQSGSKEGLPESHLPQCEKELPFETVFLELGKKDQLDPEYLKLNPNGVVPTLVDGDDVILEYSVICEYLDERYPGVDLTPGDRPDGRSGPRRHMGGQLPPRGRLV